MKYNYGVIPEIVDKSIEINMSLKSLDKFIYPIKYSSNQHVVDMCYYWLHIDNIDGDLGKVTYSSSNTDIKLFKSKKEAKIYLYNYILVSIYEFKNKLNNGLSKLNK